MPDKALDGIRVLDLTHHVAGPYCTKLLADFGADVVKIERPGSGDPARHVGPFVHDEPHPEKSLLFLYLNTNKRSVTLNLKSDAGVGILKELVRDADLLVENFAPRVMPSLGLGYEALREVNPGLVMVSISNFGQTGPYRDYKATDIVEYALGGLMYVFGSADREPLKHALRQAQFKAGVNAAGAAAIALYHQQLNGEGQWVDVSIQECIASALRDTTSLYTYMGAIRGRQPHYSGDMPRYPVKAQDGYIVPIAYGRVDWQVIADFLGAPELKDARFATPEARVANAKELHESLTERLGQRDKLELFYAAHQRSGLIFGVVQDPREVMECPQYQARGYFVEVEHPVAGVATYPGAPFLMSATPWECRSPAPTLGQHNEEILCGRLGYSAQELAQLRESEVI
jgi:CoA:oxalate CoA-transferase